MPKFTANTTVYEFLNYVIFKNFNHPSRFILNTKQVFFHIQSDRTQTFASKDVRDWLYS